MALSCGSDKDQQSVSFESAQDGGSGLEGSKQSSSSSNSGDLTWNHHRALLPTQDNEVGIPGEKSDQKALDALLTLISLGGQC